LRNLLTTCTRGECTFRNKTYCRFPKDWPPSPIGVGSRSPKSTFFHKLFRERAKVEEERSKVCGNEQAGLQKLGRCHRYTLRFIVSSGSLPFPAPSSPSGPPSELFRSFRPKSVLRGAGRQGSPAGHQKLVSSNRHDLCCALRWAIVARLAPCAPPPSFCDENRLRKPF